MATHTNKFIVREVKVRRENGDLDTMYLCRDCESSTADFLKILRRRRCDAYCDRCGKSSVTANQKSGAP